MSLGNIFLLTNNQQLKKVYEFIIERIANNHQRTTKKDIKKGNLSCTLLNFLTVI